MMEDRRGLNDLWTGTSTDLLDDQRDNHLSRAVCSTRGAKVIYDSVTRTISNWFADQHRHYWPSRPRWRARPDRRARARARLANGL